MQAMQACTPADPSGGDEMMRDQAEGRWEDLPGAFLCHILCIVPWKRSDVKAVCRAWRAAINSSLTTVELPPRDLALLAQLPNIKHLVVSSARMAGFLPPGAWDVPPDCWAALDARVLDQLVSLRLAACPDGVLEQLARGLLSSHDGSGDGGWAAPPAALGRLRELSVSKAGDVAALMRALAQRQARPEAAGCLQQLQALHLGGWRAAAGGQLMLPPRLPALRELELQDVWGSAGMPAAVLDCTRLTRLALRNLDGLEVLPDGISVLADLRVLEVSSTPSLRSLGGGLTALTALTELDVSSSSGLWLDYSVVEPLPPPAGAPGSSTGSGGGSSSAAAARAALPLPALSHQQQAALLPELARLPALRVLRVARNYQCMALPRVLAEMPRLHILDARGCSLRWLGEDALQCQGLQQLLLADTLLTELPDEISCLQELKVLDVGGCNSLWRLPTTLLQLPALERLVLPYRGVAQHVVEQLELSKGVDVEEEPGLAGESSEDGGGSWGGLSFTYCVAGPHGESTDEESL